MKILHTVESYYPSLGGMQEVVKQLSERLVKLGHEVTVATRYHEKRTDNLLNGVKIEPFKISGNAVRGYSSDPGEITRYENFLLSPDFDVVTNFAAQQWATDLALPILENIPSKKVFVPTGFSGFYMPEYKDYFEKMKSWIKKYDMNVFLSDSYRDINFARENSVQNIVLIPNGAGEDEFSTQEEINIREKLNIPADAFLILHLGSYTLLKGHKEALEIFLRSHIPDSVLLMVGDNIESFRQQITGRYFLSGLRRKLKNGKIILTDSLTRKETVAAFKSADLFLFPSNIECSPIVLFESMAAETPFLVTDVGNSPEIINWSGGGLLLPTDKDKNGNSHVNIKAAIGVLQNVYNDSQLRKSLSQSGHTSWKNNFTWEVIAEKYLGMYKKLIQQ